MRRIRQKCRLIPFDQVPQPGQRESCRNEQQPDDPVKPDDNDGREADRDRDHVQRTIERMIVRAVVM